LEGIRGEQHNDIEQGLGRRKKMFNVVPRERQGA